MLSHRLVIIVLYHFQYYLCCSLILLCAIQLISSTNDTYSVAFIYVLPLVFQTCCCQLTPVLLFMSSPTCTHYIHLTTNCLPCMSDIIAHTEISTRTSRSNVKANKLDVNNTQYDGTCKGSSSEDLQKDVESSSPQKVLALTWPVIWVQHAYNVLECIYSVAMPCAQHADHACKYAMPSCFSVPIPFMITCFQIQVLSFYSTAMPSA